MSKHLFFTIRDRALSASCGGRSFSEPLLKAWELENAKDRIRAACEHDSEETRDDRTALGRFVEHGPFTFPGGYPVHALTADGEFLCWDCCADPSNPVHGFPDDDPQWEVVAYDVYWEGPALTCAHCDKRFESAYGNPDRDPCACEDTSCKSCHGFCDKESTTTLYRVDMSDRTGKPFCDSCAVNASENGLFSDSRGGDCANL